MPKLCPSCETCGQRALVSILFGYRQGEPLLKRFCLKCADSAVDTGQRVPIRLRSLGGVRFVVHTLAALLGLLALFADTTLLHARSGFGNVQWAACGAGFALVLFGGLMRTSVVSAAGLAALGLGLFADVLFGHHANGFGWKQTLLLSVALGLVLACMIRRVPRSRGPATISSEPLRAQVV